MNKETLVAELENGSHLVEFQKKDGTITVRRLTMDRNIVPPFVPKTERVTKQSLDTVRAWDVVNLKFCSLIPGNVIEIRA